MNSVPADTNAYKRIPDVLLELLRGNFGMRVSELGVKKRQNYHDRISVTDQFSHLFQKLCIFKRIWPGTNQT